MGALRSFCFWGQRFVWLLGQFTSMQSQARCSNQKEQAQLLAGGSIDNLRVQAVVQVGTVDEFKP
jgi:hypothetical protein